MKRGFLITDGPNHYSRGKSESLTGWHRLRARHLTAAPDHLKLLLARLGRYQNASLVREWQALVDRYGTYRH